MKTSINIWSTCRFVTFIFLFLLEVEYVANMTELDNFCLQIEKINPQQSTKPTIALSIYT